MFTSFSLYQALAGGLLIGLAASLLLYFNGKIAGISGISASLMKPGLDDRFWRIAFIIGLLVGALLYQWISGSALDITVTSSWPLLVLAGLLVGFGSRMGSGCTSGHGVCGLSRLSRRSVTATLVFMTVAVATATTRHYLVGGLS